MSHRFWTTTLTAAGPAALTCALLGVVEFSNHRTIGIDSIGAYPLALLAFSPAIPPLAAALNRAFPEAVYGCAKRSIHVGWLVASWFATFWHILAAELFVRLAAVSIEIPWEMIIRYSACFWLVTACGSVASSRLRGRKVSRSDIPPPTGPTEPSPGASPPRMHRTDPALALLPAHSARAIAPRPAALRS